MTSPEELKPGPHLYFDVIGNEPIRVKLRDVGPLGLGMFFEERADEDDEFVLASEVSGRLVPA